MKRSLVSLGAIVALSSSAIAPASAFEIERQGTDKCVVTVTAADKELIGKEDMADKTTLSFAQVKKLRAEVVEVQKNISRELVAKQKELKEATAKEDEAKAKELKAQISKLKSQETALLGVVAQTATCVLPTLNELSSAASDGNLSSVVDGLEILGLSSVKGENTSPLSSADGKPNDIGIGLIVGGAVLAGLSLLVTLAPFFARLLPPQLRAMV